MLREGFVTGAELRERREAAGLSQRELARQAGLHHKAVAYWERKPALDSGGYAVNRLADALGWRIPTRYTRARDEVLELFEALAAMLPHRLAMRLFLPRVRCGARTRKGTPCKAMSEPSRKRCRFHGGKSAGPRTHEGRARIAEAQRQRWARWRALNGSG